MAADFDQESMARAALSTIVSDPEHGPGVFSDPSALANLLSDLSPEAPRETGLLPAAARSGLAQALQDHISQGMDPATAIKITASALETATAYSAEACAWAAGEFAIALGLATPDAIPRPAPAGQRTHVAGRATAPSASAPDATRTRHMLARARECAPALACEDAARLLGASAAQLDTALTPGALHAHDMRTGLRRDDQQPWGIR